MSTGAGWKTYRDFVLKVVRAGEGRYRVEAQAPTGEARADFEVPFDERDLELFLLKVGRPRKVPTRRLPEEAQDAVGFGARLYRAAICDQVRDLFARARDEAARSGQGLRLQLRLADAPELSDWPWEFLNDGRDFLALSADTPIVRYLDLPEPPRPIRVQPPLRILVTVSAPQGLPELDVEQEKLKLLESLAVLSERGVVTVDFTPDATLRTLQSTLRRARSEGHPYHVWHYVGHGAFIRSRNASVLAFCTREGMLHRVGDLELGTLFDGYPEIRLVLLNACEGARPDPQDPLAGVAAALVRRGVPAVIGMQFEISDEAAKTLSQVFYEALVDGLPVDAALTEARRAVFFTPNWTEWATPVLYMRAPDGQLFDLLTLPPRPDATQPVRTSTPEASQGQARSAQLASLYTDARAAYYTSRWERAVELLGQVVALQEDYERAADMLREARRRQALQERYTRGSQAYEAGEWDEAIEHLEAAIALEPGHEAATHKLEEARRQKRLADLYADARQLHQAQEWQAVLALFEDLQAIEAGYPDPDGLLGSAREALEAEKRARRLADRYERGLRHMDDARWPEALECLEQVAALEPGYRDVQGLLDRARAEQGTQERALTLAQRYAQGSAAYDAGEWAEAIRHLEAVVALEAGYRDVTDRLQQARRRKELADRYAEARRLHQAQQWQAAIHTLERLQTAEPAYPDPEGLLDSARAALEAQERARRAPEPARPGGQPSTRRGVPSWPAWTWVILASVALWLLGGVIWGVRSARERSAAQAMATSAAQAMATSAAQATATSAAQATATSTLQPTATFTASVTPAPQVGTTQVREKDGAVMVYVPAGEFWMGSDEGDPDAFDDEKPQHKLFVDAFWIDRTEVTNAQYRQCVEAGVCSPPQDSSSLTRESYYGDPEYDNYPVINVSWDQARTYAEWVGGRLPTEAEWEVACRGPGESTYPWGDRLPDDTLLNYGDNVGDTSQIGSYPEGKSWCGALDLSGNVWEWTQSLYQGYPYDPADGREDLDAGGARVVRGGAFSDGTRDVRCAARLAYAVPWDGYRGFRVVVGPGFPSGR